MHACMMMIVSEMFMQVKRVLISAFLYQHQFVSIKVPHGFRTGISLFNM